MSARSFPSVSLVIPARNEAGSIGWVLRRIPSVVDEVILVDSSSDGTVDVARSIRPDLVVIHEERRGKGAALRAGFAAASGQHLVMIDADGSMDPMEIPRYVLLLSDGFDMVKGSRQLEGGGSSDFTRVRAAGNRALRDFANVLYGAHFTELCYGFLAFRRAAIDLIAPTADGFEIEAELILRAKRLGLRITEVPTFERDRIAGVSKLHAVSDGTRILRTILRERTRKAFPAPPARGQDLESERADRLVAARIMASVAVGGGPEFAEQEGARIASER